MKFMLRKYRRKIKGKDSYSIKLNYTRFFMILVHNIIIFLEGIAKIIDYGLEKDQYFMIMELLS